MRVRRLCILLLLLAPGFWLLAPAARAENRFPPPDFRGGHQLPVEQFVAPRAPQWAYIDTGVLFGTLCLAAMFALKLRSRTAMFWLSAFSIAYFGFYREGCVCSVGSIQNVSLAIAEVFRATPDHPAAYSLPWVVGVYFALPLAIALFFGRVFCAGVCPLGTIQDVVLWKPLQVPAWVESALGLFAHLYLGLAVLYAAVGSDFVICTWDPFVGFYRLTGTAFMLLLGGVLLVLSMFIGRFYCRFICPYSVLLRLISPLAQWKVHVSPKACIDCKLCEAACPYGAITKPTRQPEAGSVRRRVLLAVVLIPLGISVLGFLGYRSRSFLAAGDRTVQLARLVLVQEQAKKANDTKRFKELGALDEIRAFRRIGAEPQQVYADAAAIENRMGLGGALLGVWIGLAIGLRLLRLALPRKRTIYDADAAGCVACARCFLSCPVELERRGMVAPERPGFPVVANEKAVSA